MQTSRKGSPHRPLSSGAHRIALYGAIRGTLAAAVPFLLLRQTGHPAEALFTAIAVLNVSIADSGGPYRQRLAVMGGVTVIVPLVLFAGMQAQSVWWLAVGLTFVVALVGGMARLYGGVGTAVGLISGIVFLIGIEIPANFTQSLVFAFCYFAGAAWTVLIALLVWRLRPYRRARYELGEGFGQLAAIVEEIRRQARATGASHRHEAQLAEQQRRVSATFETVEQILGDTMADTETVPGFLSDLIVLLRAGSRINAAAASLGSALDRPGDALSDAGRAPLTALLGTFETACTNTAAALLDQTAEYDLSQARGRLKDWEQAVGDSDTLEEVHTLLNVILRQLENAQHVMERLAEPLHGGSGLLPPLHGPAFPSVTLSTLWSNLSFRSLVFRHALRVAVAASAGTAAYLLLRIPHGIWLPLTVLIVLQPQLGATLSRAFQRTGGTVLGAVVAGFLVYLFQGTAAMEAAILVCLFLTLLFFRRRYWVAVTFLTPMIILLLSLLIHRPWIEIIERIGNTLGGAGLALLAGYVLWPSWEYRQLPDAVAEAIDANRRYLAALIEAVRRGVEPGWPLAGVRAQAELATTNARASLDRMRTEPRWMHKEARKAVVTVTHVERLCRHVTRLSIYLHETPGVAPAFGPLGEAFEGALTDLAAAARNSKPPQPDDRIEQAYLHARRGWRAEPPARPGDLMPVDALMGSVIGDIQSLRAALAGDSAPTPPAGYTPTTDEPV